MAMRHLLQKPVLIIVGKSASGKDTLQKKLTSAFGCIPFVSVTTRPMRDGEKEGVNYFFRGKDDFFRLVEQGKIFEYRSYETLVNNIPDTWFYGSIKQELLPSTYYTVVVDIDGAIAYAKAYGGQNCTVAFVECPDEIREKRARERGSFNKQEWDRRMTDDKEKFSKERLAELGKVLGQEKYFRINNVGENIAKAEVQEKYFVE